MKRKIIRIGTKGKPKVTKEERSLTGDTQTKVELIQALIPLGLMAVSEYLEEELERLAGARYSRQRGLAGHYRWGRQWGSVYLSDQKLNVLVPRVRDIENKKEVPLENYQSLQQPRNADEGVLRRILLGISCRNYEACAEAVPEAFGLSPSTISRRFIKVSSRKLKELMERDLSEYDFVALFIDGKSFAEEEILGFDHSEIGYEVCQSWGIPESLTTAIRYHHNPSRSNENELAYIIHLADYIAILSGIGIDMDNTSYQIEDTAMQFLGLQEEDLSNIMPEVVQGFEKLTKKVFDD